MKPDKVLGPFTTQNVLFIFSIACAGITTVISLFLIMKHLHRYTEPRQQRQIIRIIFTPVVFSVLYALSVLNYKVAIYLQPLTALYETFALAALWLLYTEYVAPDEHTRLSYFANLENRKPKGSYFKPKGYEVIPGGSQKWYQSKYCAVFVYVVIDIVTTFVEEITQVIGDYCETSFSPKYAHVWVFVIQNVSIGWAINAIIRYYIRMKKEPEFAAHKPGLKLLSFKLIVGINFFQDIIFDLLIATGAVKGSHKVTGYDWKYGIPAAVVAFEQIFFSIFFHYSFRSREYHETMKEDLVTPRMGTLRAALHAYTPLDLIKGMFNGVTLLFGGIMPFDAKPSRGGRGLRQRVGRDDDSTAHLEPMSYQPSYEMKMDNPYSSTPAAIHVTAPQQTGYTDNSGYGYNAPSYPPPASYAEAPRGRQSPPDFDEYGGETQKLHPGGYARAHSRDSSIDEGDARSMKHIV